MTPKIVASLVGTTLLAVAAAAAVKLYDVPAKVQVLESQMTGTEKRLDRIEGKLDAVLELVPRRR